MRHPNKEAMKLKHTVRDMKTSHMDRVTKKPSRQHVDNMRYEKEKHWAEHHQAAAHKEFEKLKHEDMHMREEMDGYKKGGCVKKPASKMTMSKSYGMSGIPKGTHSDKMTYNQHKGNLNSVYY